MKNIVLRYGLISGVLLAGLMAVMVPFCMNGHLGLDMTSSMVIGYTAQVIAFLTVFFGIRSYRDKIKDGTIGYWRAFGVGILIALVTAAVYVIGWEIVYWNFLPDFADRYAAAMLEQMRAAGESAEKIAAAEKEMAEFKVLYNKPLFNVGMTFIEVFPVGLVMTLVSAGILRRKVAPGPPAAATAMA